MLVLVPLAHFGWRGLQSARSADPDYQNPVAGLSGVEAEGVPISEFVSELFALFTPSSAPSGFHSIDTSLIEPWLQIFQAMMTMAPLVVVLTLAHEPARRRFGGSVIVAAFIGSVVVAVHFWSSGGFYLTSIPARYGLALLPMILVCMGFVFDERRAGRHAAVALAIGGAATIPALVVLL